jgi:hypothetical protein
MTAAVSDISRRRTYRGEEEWFELLEQFGHRPLRAAFIQAGISPQVAGGLVWFLDDQMALERTQTDKSRVRYRSILTTLDKAQVAAAAKRAFPGLFNSGTRAA